MGANDPLAPLIASRSPRQPDVPLPEGKCCEKQAFRGESQPPGKGRRKLWQLPSRFHCAVVGTCLTVEELRGLAPELGMGDFRALSDYEVHTRFVGMAGEKGPVSQRLQGMLDRRYRGAIRRYRRLREEQPLRDQWHTDVNEGRVAGAFWALASHPATPTGLAYEIYGEIHMLGHQVGAGIRAGLRRLAELEEQNEALTDKLRKTEEQAHQYLEAKQRALDERDQWRQRAHQAEDRASKTEGQLAEWREGQPVPELMRRIRTLEGELRHQTRRAERAENRLPGPSKGGSEPEPAKSTEPVWRTEKTNGKADLKGRRILCVGGRTGLSDHYRAIVEAANGEFLHHDGGIEQSGQQLHRLLERADQVICPVDCVSHQASRCVKDHCRRSGLPCLFLESASVTALSRALPALQERVGS